jgi:hypothetical protein
MFYKSCPICYEISICNICPIFNCCKNGRLCCDNCIIKINKEECLYCFKKLENKYYLNKIIYCFIFVTCMILFMYYSRQYDCGSSENRLNYKIKQFAICMEETDKYIPKDFIDNKNLYTYNLMSCEWIKK